MNRRRFIRTLLAAGALTALPASLQACAGAADVKAKEARSKATRVAPSPEALAALPAFVAARNAFAWKLYRTVVEADKTANAFISPYSISFAMAMAYAGATGTTASELATALEFSDLPADTHDGMNALDQEVAKSAEKQRDHVIPLELASANSAWFDAKTDFVPAYLDTLAGLYGAGAWRVGFKDNPGAARVEINDWVEEQTKERIKDLIPEGAITTETVLVLANAIYFKAQWLNEFRVESTAPKPFTLLSGIPRGVPFMHQTEQHRHAQVGNVEAIELTYAGGAASMVILMPPEGDLDPLRANIETVAPAAIAAMKQTNMRLSMPKWKFSDEYALVPAFRQLGVKDAFGPAATFEITQGTPPVYISDIIHKTFVAVDEKGTEAAAATAVVLRTTSAPGAEPIEVNINRPFVFFIRHIPTGAILFMGRVVEPAE